MNSGVYQLSSESNATNQNDNIFTRNTSFKRLHAEVILDAMSTGHRRAHAISRLSGGNASAAVARYAGEIAISDRLSDGRARIVCDAAERSFDPTIAQALHVINGDTLNKKLSAPDGFVALFLKLGLSDSESWSMFI